MKIHEYQAKELLSRFGVATTRGGVAESPEEARRTAEELSSELFVVKAQIHAGGRGKGGGVKLAKSPDEVEELASEILGMQLITHQTGPEGQQVRKIYVQQGLDIERELYIGVVLDRSQSKLVLMASQEGGIEIERVAAETPEKILTETVDPVVGLQPFQARKLAFGLGLETSQIRSAVKFMTNLVTMVETLDASLAEINPLAVTPTGDIVALDAKINLDDNALFKHPELPELRDPHEEDPLEIKAHENDLNYIKLDGDVGCMVNGAGLAMATMDIIKLAGGQPANFLDVGGSASVVTVRSGFEILMSDPNVRAVLINIFGGIVRCDRVAAGVIEAMSQVNVDMPVVVRLEGTNAREAAELLDASDLEFSVAKSLEEAANMVTSTLN